MSESLDTCSEPNIRQSYKRQLLFSAHNNATMCAALVSSPSESRMGSPSATHPHPHGHSNYGYSRASGPSITGPVAATNPTILASNPNANNGGTNNNIGIPAELNRTEPPPDVLLALLSRNRALEGKIHFFHNLISLHKQ